jgi:hypothetical protein
MSFDDTGRNSTIPGSYPPVRLLAALADPDAVLHGRGARTLAVEHHRLASRAAMGRYRSELMAWLLDLLTELFGAEVEWLVFGQKPGLLGGLDVRLLGAWDRVGALLWRDPLSRNLERELERTFGEPVYADVDQASRRAVQNLIDRIQSADSWPWFYDLDLGLGEEGWSPGEVYDVHQVVVTDAREHIAQVRAEAVPGVDGGKFGEVAT